MTNRHESLAREMINSFKLLSGNTVDVLVSYIVAALDEAYTRGALSNVEGPGFEEYRDFVEEK